MIRFLLAALAIVLSSPSYAREVLSADYNMYVDSSGQDVGDCQQLEPCFSPSYAYQWAQRNLDLGGFRVIVHLRGEYSLTGGWAFTGPLVGATGPKSFTIDGGWVVPTKLNYTGPWGLFFVDHGAQIYIEDMTISSANFGILVSHGVVMADEIWVGPSGNAFVSTAGPSAQFICSGAKGITFLSDSDPGYGFVAETNSFQGLGCPLKISGHPHFRTAFAQANLGGIVDVSNATTVNKENATGRGCLVLQNGKIATGGTADEWFFPGDQPCSVDAKSSLQ